MLIINHAQFPPAKNPKSTNIALLSHQCVSHGPARDNRGPKTGKCGKIVEPEQYPDPGRAHIKLSQSGIGTHEIHFRKTRVVDSYLIQCNHI